MNGRNREQKSAMPLFVVTDVRVLESNARPLERNFRLVWVVRRERAEQLALVADSAAAQGARAVRLTPWRAILVAGLAPEGAQNLVATLADAGLVVDSADPVLSVVACPGAPDCESSSVVTHAPALALASLFAGVAPATRLHVTGCPKGCAHPRPAPFTLVGRNGGFDLVVDGAPDAAPVATGLDAAAAHCEIARRMSQSAPT